jgi:hypothetical protein
MNLFPLSRCASATKIVCPLESTVATQPQLQPALLSFSATSSHRFTGRFCPFLSSHGNHKVYTMQSTVPSNKQITGMRGVYLVAAELAKHGFIASPTSRSARGADILVTDTECKRAFSIQVKTKSTQASYWLMSRDYKRFVSDSHIYIFVSIKDAGSRIRTDDLLITKTFRVFQPKI